VVEEAEDHVKNVLTGAQFTGNIEIREHPPEGQAAPMVSIALVVLALVISTP
jgi:hypothetical protein